MTYIHTKTITEEIEILRVLPNYVEKYSLLKRHRRDITCCELCDVAFNLDEPVALAFTNIDRFPVRKENRHGLLTPANCYICTDCTGNAIAGGAVLGSM